MRRSRLHSPSRGTSRAPARRAARDRERRRAVSGERSDVELAVVALLAEGHVLIEDVPGVGKTTLARALARSLDCSFSRLQFTPDVLPSDVTGVSVFDQRTSEFAFRPGPVFANLVLADEINRASPRTQSALLECMQERQVTVDGVARPARGAVLRDRDAEPDRAGRHVPAARGAARPLRAAALARLPGPGRRGAHARRPDGAEGSPLETLAPVADAAELVAAVHACRARARRARRCTATSSRSAAHARRPAPRARREPARRRRRSCGSRAPTRSCAGATTCCRTTSRRWRRDALAHRLLPAAGAPADVAAVARRAARAGARAAVNGAAGPALTARGRAAWSAVSPRSSTRGCSAPPRWRCSERALVAAVLLARVWVGLAGGPHVAVRTLPAVRARR